MSREHFPVAIVSPVRNEQDNLPRLADSLLSQTHLPDKWLIVDDSSSDTTPSTIDKLEGQYDWISSMRLPDRGYYSRGEGSYAVAAEGFRHMLASFNPEALGIFDADISFEETTIEHIRDAFLNSDRLGIYGGEIVELRNGQWVPPVALPEDFARGACKVFRKQCYQDIGRLKFGQASNIISNMEALMKGWDVKRDASLLIRHHRSGGTRDSRLSRHIKAGAEAAYIGSDPLLVLARGARKMMKSKLYFVGGLIFLSIYFNNAFLHKNQYPDPELLKFIQKRHRQILLEGFYKW